MDVFLRGIIPQDPHSSVHTVYGLLMSVECYFKWQQFKEVFTANSYQCCCLVSQVIGLMYVHFKQTLIVKHFTES